MCCCRVSDTVRPDGLQRALPRKGQATRGTLVDSVTIVCLKRWPVVPGGGGVGEGGVYQSLCQLAGAPDSIALAVVVQACDVYCRTLLAPDASKAMSIKGAKLILAIGKRKWDSPLPVSHAEAYVTAVECVQAQLRCHALWLYSCRHECA